MRTCNITADNRKQAGVLLEGFEYPNYERTLINSPCAEENNNNKQQIRSNQPGITDNNDQEVQMEKDFNS